MLSLLYPVEELGGNLPSSFPEALAVYEESAKGGDPVACAGMGTLYLHGWGVPQDYKVARDYFMGARNRGHARGFTGMGILLVHGWGGERRDFMEAAKQLRAGVDRVRSSHVVARRCLAAARNGSGFPQGDGLALYEEAMLSLNRLGQELDWRKVFDGVAASARKGYAVALCKLGSFYFTGTPVHPYDLERAWAVLQMAQHVVRCSPVAVFA
jgi:TPR repeat protein